MPLILFRYNHKFWVDRLSHYEQCQVMIILHCTIRWLDSLVTLVVAASTGMSERVGYQSTRHNRAHNKTTSTSRNYLQAVSLGRHPEIVLNTDGVITAICVT